MLYNRLIWITFFFIFAVFAHKNAQAVQEQIHANGLAMHGTPKYGPESQNLAYANPDAPKGGALKMAAIGTFDTLNPYALKGTPAQGLNLITDRLMARRWDEPFTLYPLIAEKVLLPEDRSTATFVLNPKARFHDGSPITAQDVIFSFETLREQGRPNMRRIYKLVKEAKATNERTVSFSFGEGYDRETVMIIAMMPVLSKAWWKDRNFSATLLEIQNTNGPYRIESLEPGRRITYKRDPDYWAKDLCANKGHYNFDTVTYEYFRDDSVALEAFNKGDLNLRRENDISKWMTAYQDSAQIIKYDAPHQRPEKTEGFIFNTRRTPFDDINVRKALSMVFDEDWIAKNIYYGQGNRIESFFPNSSLADPALHEKERRQTLRQKIARADSLLKEAGWSVENGLRMKDGKPLSFELILSAPEEEKIALNFKQHLKRLGVTMNIRVLDAAAFQKRAMNYDYDMILHHWQNSLSPGTEQMLYWACESANTPGRFNFAGICDKEIDTLARQIADAKTYEDLTALAHSLDRALKTQAIIIPLFYSGTDHIAHSPALGHTDPPPLYGSVIETWWMDENNTHKQD